jgi:uncharacterized membrane protein
MDKPEPPPPVPTSPLVAAATGTGGSSLPPGGRTVDAGQGVAWWRDAWRLFTASPWVFVAIVILFVVLSAALSVVPVLGSIASTVLQPVLAGGMFAGCRALDRGGELTIGHLFAGFSDRFGPLAVVGLLALAGLTVILFVFGALLLGLVGLAGVSALLTGDPLQLGVAALATLGLGALLALLVAALLGIPLVMALWFAPALVALRQDEPVAAMKTSFGACLANVVPFLVYGLLGIGFAIVASIPLGLGWLVLAPVSVASIYTSYKDIFGD